MIKRFIYLNLWKELSKEKSMIFLSGARQVGKTTLAKQILQDFSNKIYFNWDVIENRKKLILEPTFFEKIDRVDSSIPLVVFDEIHKYKRWKDYLKGIYDQYSSDYKFLVLGSGRLDVYQKGSDSLAGRYFQFHLFPFTLAELSSKRRSISDFLRNPLDNFDLNKHTDTKNTWDTLFNFGGFPEPFLKAKRSFYLKWANTYHSQIVREDIRSISDIKNIDLIETLFYLLPLRVGNPLSINNLSIDLQTSYKSIKDWLRLYEIFYLIFRIKPWTKNISRSILKEQKLYLFNYPQIKDPSFRFENMVAVELLRMIYNWNEYGFGKFSLNYIRNKEKEEVDFVLVNENSPFLLIETKFSEENISKSLINFQNKLNIPAVQLVNKENIFRCIKNQKNRILAITAHKWLSSLP